MTEIFAALRALVYGTGFVVVWGWLALEARSLAGDVTLPPSGRVLGAVLMVVGGVLVLVCVAWFVVVGRGTPAPFDPPRAFVPGGPYRWVRNPMYLGALTILIGFGLWHVSLAMVLFALPAAAVAHLFVVVYEEPTLRRTFGAPYATYVAQVKRWVPKAPSRHTGAGA